MGGAGGCEGVLQVLRMVPGGAGSPPHPTADHHSPMWLMIWVMVGWKSSLMASGDMRSIPCDDHLTKFTLGGDERRGGGGTWG